jgi:hypothetical protein
VLQSYLSLFSSVLLSSFIFFRFRPSPRYHYNSSNPKEPIALGDTQVKVKDVVSAVTALPVPSDGRVSFTSSSITKIIKIVSSKDGKPAGEAEVICNVMSLDEACNVQEHCVYEFQRWNPVQNWGHSDPPGHLLITDPGR